MSEKNILEQALLQINTLEEAVKQNAKGILASTMKEELKDLLKESLEDEDETHPMDEVTPDGEEKDMSDDESAEDETADDDAEDTEDLDNAEPTKGIDGMDSEEGDDETGMDNFGGSTEDSEESDEDAETDDFGGDTEADDVEDDDDVMDMTGASDDEVVKVFRAMKPEDGIVVKKDGNKVEFHDGEHDYIIKLDENEEVSEDETLYEIDLDEEDENAPYETEVHEDENAPYEKKVAVKKGVHESKDAPFEKKAKVKKDVHEAGGDPYEKKVTVKKGVHEDEDGPYETEVHEDENAPFEKKVSGGKKMQADEAARTKSNPHGDKNGMDRAGLKSKKMYKAGSSINEEVETLRKQNAEYKKALVLFKDKLNEVAVFNANLAYATRLFTENTTTKQEKMNILKRFDSVSSLQESKNLFNIINTELGSKTTVTESVVEKISNTPSTSASHEVLAESKAYEAPQFARMRDLMRKVK
jgi:hypothetical protein